MERRAALQAAAADSTSSSPAGATQHRATALARATLWEDAPYRIVAFVECDPAAEWTAPRRAALLSAIESESRGFIGGPWRLDASAAPAELHWDLAARIDRVTTAMIPAPALDRDKVMLVGLAAAADGRRQIHIRELDVRTGLWGAAIERTTPVGAEPAREIVHGLWDAFRPLIRIDEISDKGVVTGAIRGGDLPLATRSLEMVHRGMPLRPLIRHFDALGRTAKDGVFPIAWTWLGVEQVDGASVKCRLNSGIENPLELHFDGRTEYLGLAATTRARPATRLIVRARGAGGRLLEDVEMLIRRPGAKSAKLAGRTDEQGAVEIASPAIEVETVYLRSGDDLLARFPLVPGVEPRIVAAVEDNGRRLASGALVARLDDELIDLAAQQSILVMRFEHAIGHGNFLAADRTLAVIKTLPTSEEFVKSIAERRAALTKIAADPAPRLGSIGR